jgi:hypothetical protein
VFVPTGTQPPLVYFNIGGFGFDKPVNSLNVQLGSNTSALRGQSLSLKVINNNTVYTSPRFQGAHLDVLDGTTGDVISSLNVVVILSPMLKRTKQ